MLAFFMKVLVCLLIAGAIGYLTAWLLRGLAIARLRETHYRLTSDLSARDNQVLAAQSQMQDLRAKQALAETELAALGTKNKELTSAIYSELQKGIENAENLRREQDRYKSDIELALQRQKEIEDTSRRLNETISKKDSDIARLELELAPLLALPATVAARDSELKEIRSKLDQAVAEQARYDRERADSRNSLETRHQEREELLASRSHRINELEGLMASAKNRLADLESLAISRAAEVTRVNEQLISFAGMPATLAALETELRTVKLKLDDATQAARAKDHEFSVTRAQIESELLQARGRTDSEVSELKAQIADLSMEIQSREHSFSALRSELDSARHSLESRSAMLQESETARTAVVAALKAKDTELARLRSDLATLTILPGKIAAIKGELSSERQRIMSLETELLQMVQTLEEGSLRPPRQFAIAPDDVDDLKHIYGVGPVIEKTLHGLGVYQFKQVALWNTEDIKFFDSQLQDFHGRIEREYWVRSAQEEHYKKYGEWLGEGQPSVTMPETNR